MGPFSGLLSTAAQGELKCGVSWERSCSNLIQLLSVTGLRKLAAASKFLYTEVFNTVNPGMLEGAGVEFPDFSKAA